MIKVEKDLVLKRLFPKETIKIEATTDKAGIAKSKEVFKSWLDPDFDSLDLDVEQKPSEGVEVEVYELKKGRTFKEIFASFKQDLDSLCFTQQQIVKFCQMYEDRLHPNWVTFFPFKENNDYFIAYVRKYPDGLYALALCYEFNLVWEAKCSYRLVVPKTP
ncbi:MAG: hypothetical protein ACLFNO_03505 [Parcubacteria group bacterium]